MSKDFDGQNRGFGFANFYNHAAATHAKKVLSAPNFKCGLHRQLPVHPVISHHVLAAWRWQHACSRRSLNMCSADAHTGVWGSFNIRACCTSACCT